MDHSSLDLARLRQEYSLARLQEQELADEPFSLVDRWLKEAIQAQVPEPNAFALATADAKGQPHVRIVLLKGFEPPYLYFYTNYESAKAREIAQNPRVAAAFWWEPLQRQLRVEGRIEKAPESVSDAYFASRPYGSQIGAWASPQSQPIAPTELEERWHAYQQKFPPGAVPRPPHWGGYRILPERIEFWQGRPNRLHDRILYVRSEGCWLKHRLAP